MRFRTCFALNLFFGEYHGRSAKLDYDGARVVGLAVMVDTLLAVLV